MVLSSTINPSNNEEWIQLIGKYIINMGAIEIASRLIIVKINGTDNVPIYKGALAKRLEYLKVRFQKTDKEKHEKTMSLFDVLDKHTKFRNCVAHSGIIYKDDESGTKRPVGLMSFTPDDPDKIGEIISLEELKGRVNESAIIGAQLLELQNDFSI